MIGIGLYDIALLAGSVHQKSLQGRNPFISVLYYDPAFRKRDSDGGKPFLPGVPGRLN